MNALLDVRDLVVRFPARSSGGPREFLAVDGVSFALTRGEALGLVGESGSGKSTIARAVLGLARPSAGSIRFDGVELVGANERARRAAARRIGVVFQDPFAALDPRWTALSIVAEPLALQGRLDRAARRRRAAQLLEQVGLDPRHGERFPHEFSGGQRQRIAIARALASEPELLLLDEPTSALDVSVQASIVNLLAELARAKGLAYLFISHDLAVVRRLCGRVLVLQKGRVVEAGTRDELFGAPRHAYTRALLAAVPEVPRAVPPATLRSPTA
ncbi:MAG: ATP-binding cassette domain-containing protein [Planctomycetota bacterium]